MVEATALRPATESEALEAIRKAGQIAGVVAFSKLVGWERTRAQRVLTKWEGAGLIAMKPTPGNKTMIEAARLPNAQPDAQPAQLPVLLAHPGAHPAQGWAKAVAGYVAPVLLGMVGIALAATGMVETASYALTSGGVSSLAKAVGADVRSLLMPATIAALWRRRSPAMALALVLWIGGVVVTTANIAGYVGEHVEQYQTGRETGATERTLVLERLARLREERKAIVEARPPAAIVAAINNARRSEQPALREALALAKRRDALDVELVTVEQRLASLPRVATADASAAVLSAITGATISESALRKFRLACLLALPLAGGLVLSLAFALAPMRERARP